MENNRPCLECGKALTKKQMMFCSNSCKLKNKQLTAIRTKPKEKQEDTKRAICKHTGKVFKDHKNYSGILTRHVNSLGIKVDSVFNCFNIVEVEKKEKYQCKYCKWETVDVINKSGCITNHIKTHNIEVKDHIEKYPEEEAIFKFNIKSDIRLEFFENNPKSYITCLECGKKMKKITNKHLSIHNMTPNDYRIKYNKEILSSEDTVEKYKIIYELIRDKINVTNNISKGEQELLEIIKSIDPDVKKSDKSVLNYLELDIYSEKHKIAVEYDGLAYHSEFFGKKDRLYHLNKTNLCEEKGIRLIHVFEDEWKFKKDIVESKIKKIFKQSQEKIGARKCVIKEVSPEEKNNFLNKNHIQGEDRSTHNLGLYYEKKLVAIMTFCKPRIFMGHRNIEKGVYELSRFATSINVTGGASKLLSYFIKSYSPTKIISYADRRWSSNIEKTLYDKLGFKKTKVNKPNYWYLKHYKIRSHRYGFNKQRIVNELGGDPNKTEIENMINMGYDRIWDCGTIKYEMVL